MQCNIFTHYPSWYSIRLWNTTDAPQEKIVSLILQTTRGEEALFIIPFSWNRMRIVLRDRGVLRFDKYVSKRAKNDAWDICGSYFVIPQDDDKGTVIAGDYITDPSKMKIDEGSTKDDNWRSHWKSWDIWLILMMVNMFYSFPFGHYIHNF